jgi:hypothetical protein
VLKRAYLQCEKDLLQLPYSIKGGSDLRASGIISDELQTLIQALVATLDYGPNRAPPLR